MTHAEPAIDGHVVVGALKVPPMGRKKSGVNALASVTPHACQAALRVCPGLSAKKKRAMSVMLPGVRTSCSETGRSHNALMTRKANMSRGAADRRRSGRSHDLTQKVPTAVSVRKPDTTENPTWVCIVNDASNKLRGRSAMSPDAIAAEVKSSAISGNIGVWGFHALGQRAGTLAA